MIYVAGRKVKIVTGVKSQTVNVYSASGVEGDYDYRLRLQPPFVSEDALREQAFSAVEDLVAFLRTEHKAEVEIAPSAGEPTAPSTSAKQNGDIVSRFIARARNHPVLAIIIVLGIVVVALGAFTNALSSILSLFAGIGR